MGLASSKSTKLKNIYFINLQQNIYFIKIHQTLKTNHLPILTLGAFPIASSVHTPFGPRKSGIPADVLIPAPVCTTICFDCFISKTS